MNETLQPYLQIMFCPNEFVSNAEGRSLFFNKTCSNQTCKFYPYEHFCRGVFFEDQHWTISDLKAWYRFSFFSISLLSVFTVSTQKCQKTCNARLHACNRFFSLRNLLFEPTSSPLTPTPQNLLTHLPSTVKLLVECSWHEFCIL